MPNDFNSRTLGGALIALAVVAAVAGAVVVSRRWRHRRGSGAPYLPPEATLSRAERRSLAEARESGDPETVVADIDLADRYDRYSG
jgi:hypothetical protein